MTTMHERFDEKFKVVIWEHRNSSTERFLGCEGGYCEMSPTEIKAFVQSEIDLAVAEERKRIVENIKPTKEWKDCIKIAYGQTEFCAICGFSPEKLITLINPK